MSYFHVLTTKASEMIFPPLLFHPYNWQNDSLKRQICSFHLSPLPFSFSHYLRLCSLRALLVWPLPCLPVKRGPLGMWPHSPLNFFVSLFKIFPYVICDAFNICLPPVPELIESRDYISSLLQCTSRPSWCLT